jgi:hypothetical protein
MPSGCGRPSAPDAAGRAHLSIVVGRQREVRRSAVVRIYRSDSVDNPVGTQGVVRRPVGFGDLDGERPGTADVLEVSEPLGMDVGVDEPARDGDDDTGAALEGAEPTGLDDAGGRGALADEALGDDELGPPETAPLDTGAGAGAGA